MNSFGTEIQQRRKQLGLSQQALATKLGKEQSWLSRVENDQIDIQLSNLVEIARSLGMEPMLIDKRMQDVVTALVKGEKLNQPRWKVDEDE